MIISFNEEKKQSLRFLKNYSFQTLFKSYLGFTQYFPQLAISLEHSDLTMILSGLVLVQYFKTDLRKMTDMGNFLRTEILKKENTLIGQCEDLAKVFAIELIEQHQFYISTHSQIISLPEGPILKANHQFLKKDDVEIHFKISAEGIQIFICLPGLMESNHRFVQAQDVEQGDAYLVNAETFFFSPEKPLSTLNLKEFLDLVQYGSAILFYAKKRNR